MDLTERSASRLRWALVAALALALASCGPPLGPREVAEKYLAALAKPDFSEAASWVAGEGQANLNLLRQVHDSLGAEEQAKFPIRDWQVTGHSQMGDSATVLFLFDKTKKGQLTLKNFAGQWKVVARRTL